MNRHYYLIFIFTLISWVLNAQLPKNPFEIREINPTEQIQKDSTGSIFQAFNPFELVQPTYPIVQNKDGNVKISKPLFPVISLGKTSYQQIKNILFWMLLFLSFLLALALNLNRNVALNIYRSFTNINFFSLQLRDSNEQQRFIYFILYGLYFIGLSIFIYLGYTYYIGIRHPYYLLYIAGIVCLIYVIRHISLFLFGRIFGVEKEMYALSYSVTTFGCFLGILLIPSDFLIAFINPELAKKIILIIGALIAVLYFVRHGRDILISSNLWRNSIFHFLLYLCAFEIAPLLLIYKILRIEGVLS